MKFLLFLLILYSIPSIAKETPGKKEYLLAEKAVAAKNIKKAREYLIKSCNLNYPKGCHSIGLLETRDKRFDEAKKYFLKSCTIPDGGGCYSVGWLAEKHLQNLKEAKKYYQMSCDLKFRLGCYIVKKLYLKSCNSSSGQDCYHLGLLKEVHLEEIDEAKKFYKKACDLKFNLGCTQLAKMKNKKD